MHFRELTRGKTALTRLSAQLQTTIRSLLARHGYECPHARLLSKRAQLWLDEVELDGHAGEMLAALRQVLAIAHRQADDFQKKIAAAAATHPAAQRLRTIPDISPFLSLALAVEIGDINRFPGPTQL